MTSSHRSPVPQGDPTEAPTPGDLPVNPDDGAPEPGRPLGPDPDGQPAPLEV